jgi:hypothetical protein
MSIFLALLIIGMTGLVFMAIPAFTHHGGGHEIAHDVHLHVGHGHVPHAHGGHEAHLHHSTEHGGTGHGTWGGLVPSPRTLFSLLALYGAFGQAIEHLTPLSLWGAAGVSLLPTYLFERFVVTPLWYYLLSFSAPPTPELESLAQETAEATTLFTKGKGMVKVTRDGREVQFLAELVEEQNTYPVQIGEKLTVEAVDATRERLTVRIK